MTTSGVTDHRGGFTLVELLMVMMVVTILYCISLSVIRAVTRSAYKTAARAELKSIEMAFKQYYTHYQTWPKMEGEDPGDGGTDPIIDKDLAAILTGIYDGGNDYSCNPDKIVFLEFAREDEDGVPCNPWGASSRFKSKDCRYHVDVDSDNDNFVNPSLPGSINKSAVGLQSDGRYRGGVVIWTTNPEVKAPGEDDFSDDDAREYLIGSWQ